MFSPVHDPLLSRTRFQLKQTRCWKQRKREKTRRRRSKRKVSRLVWIGTKWNAFWFICCLFSQRTQLQQGGQTQSVCRNHQQQWGRTRFNNHAHAVFIFYVSGIKYWVPAVLQLFSLDSACSLFDSVAFDSVESIQSWISGGGRSRVRVQQTRQCICPPQTFSILIIYYRPGNKI